jgi:hypothetical protein
MYVNLVGIVPLLTLPYGAQDFFFPKTCIPFPVFCSFIFSFLMRSEAIQQWVKVKFSRYMPEQALGDPVG